VRIKRLQLHGFKSCKDRAILDFPHGITGIVGPNGCGKSNIVDALRWVLGEQSAKHLRGESMEDVIFAGNERHGPLGVAEVTITFDNEEQLPHIQESDSEDEPSIAASLRTAPEIEITRRLFRSGESEYLMNGRPCRLRDITELFLGTGVGTKAYSIIEQGRVGQIVGAKPEELRLYVEEAAGTTLYRSRKLAAERKIERTRNNLLRVQDIVQELDRQAATLRRQARGAERFNELREEEAQLDRRLTASRLRNLDARTSAVRAELDGVLATEESLRLEMSDATRRRDETRARQRESEGTLEAARRALYETRNRVSELEREHRYLDSRIEELDRLCEGAQAEVVAVDEKLDQRRAEEASVRTEQADLERRLGELADARVGEDRSVAALESTITQLGRRIEDEKARLVDALAREASLQNEKGSLARQREGVQQRRQRLRDELDSLKTLTSRLVGDVEACRNRLGSLLADISATAGGKESASAKVGDVLSRKAEIERQVEHARTELASLGSRFESLRELNESFEGYDDGVRAFMSNGGKERTGAQAVIADVIEIESGYEKAVAAVLQDQLQYVVVPDPDAGMAGAAYLREMGTGRASFIPLRPRDVPSAGPNGAPVGFSMLADHIRIKEGFTDVVTNLIKDVVVADSLEVATEQWKRNGRYVTFVTRGGEVIDKMGVVTGGSGAPHDEGLLARKAELRGLEYTLAEVRSRARTASEQHARIAREAQAADEELSSLDKRLHELTVKRVSSEGDVELHRQNLTRTEERTKTVDAELRALEEEDAALGKRSQELGVQLDDLATMLRTGDGTRRELEAEREQQEESRRSHASRLEALKVREAELRQKREACEVRLQSVRSAVEELASRKVVLQGRLDRDAAELTAARERRASPEMSVEGAQRAQQDAELEFERLRAGAEQMQEGLARVQKRLDEIGSLLEETREHRSRLELALKECSLERRSVEDGARERLGVSGDEVLSVIAPAEENDRELEEGLDRVRTSIRRLGVVNVGAVAELQELEGRLGELTSQRDDLEKSIEDLRGTIARLNRMSRQRFKETFDAVNDIFQRTFPRLFQGGRAWLALTDETNLLETGVEIFVHPPGKRLGNLNLLSGGEKALTAVSLIFSLFLHKPSPFCVLDEVDAPLDDANIGRFAQMVADMCDSSQFVLITHNKRTMEACDMLYGVTMQEAGVSKIVSVEMAT